MSQYEDARARVADFVYEYTYEGGARSKTDGPWLPFNNADGTFPPLSVDDLAILVKVPETPNVGVQPEVESLISAGTPSLDGQYAEIRVLKAFANALESRIERLEAGRRMNDLPRVSFVHDAGCPAGAQSPPIPRGGSMTFEGVPVLRCTCKVGP